MTVKNNGPSWRSITRNYVISKASDAEAILDLVEAHEDVPALWTAVSAAVGAIRPERVQKISQELWGHLNLCLSGLARETFENVAAQEGLEAWRRLMKFVRRRGEVRRLELTGKIQRPEPATRALDVGRAREVGHQYERVS